MEDYSRQLEPCPPDQPPAPWQATRPTGPGWHEYARHRLGLRAAYRRLAHEVLRCRIMVWTARAALLALLLAFVQHARGEPARHRLARVVAVTGSPLWANGRSTAPLQVGDLINGDRPVHLATDGRSSVTLAMRGAQVKLPPDSWAVIQRLGYDHGRVRSFELRRGTLMAEVAPAPRLGSRFEVSCGELNVTARDSLFAVRAAGPQALVDAVRGRVEVSGPAGASLVESGHQLAALPDGTLEPPTDLPASAAQELLDQPDLLARGSLVDRLGDWCGDLGEVTVLAPTELLLRRGAAADGVAAELRDEQALTRAKVAMMAISVALMMEGTELPEHLNLATLAELGLDADQDERILTCFHSQRLAYYHRLSSDSYEVAGRAADSKATLVRCKTGAVTTEADIDG